METREQYCNCKSASLYAIKVFGFTRARVRESIPTRVEAQSSPAEARAGVQTMILLVLQTQMQIVCNERCQSLKQEAQEKLTQLHRSCCFPI